MFLTTVQTHHVQFIAKILLLVMILSLGSIFISHKKEVTGTTASTLSDQENTTTKVSKTIHQHWFTHEAR
ncbi:MAG: hypothetical protein MUE33_02600 [Cytophagaceae bacterium]|jgi:hypothetical protein|nr:hypothetical protein [Cytophagaceae bacterium]